MKLLVKAQLTRVGEVGFELSFLPCCNSWLALSVCSLYLESNCCTTCTKNDFKQNQTFLKLKLKNNQDSRYNVLTHLYSK